MNEASSFCVGSWSDFERVWYWCVLIFQSSGTNGNLSNTTTPVSLPGDPGNLVTDWPEGYDANKWGTSGNLTLNGTLTFGNSTDLTETEERDHVTNLVLSKRANRDVNTPPYAIHNGDDWALST
jgi:alpha-glucosidase